MPTGYTRTQIVLHWLIFALIVVQFLFHEPMSDAWERVEDGLPVAFSPLIAGHVFTGLLVLVLAVIRIVIKVRRGAPPLPEDEPRALKLAAHGTQMTLYGLMILMPVSGALAWFGRVEAAAEVHEVLKGLMLVFVALHIAGALYQHFVLKSDVLDRMRRPR